MKLGLLFLIGINLCETDIPNYETWLEHPANSESASLSQLVLWHCALFPQPVIRHYNPLFVKELVTLFLLPAPTHTEG